MLMPYKARSHGASRPCRSGVAGGGGRRGVGGRALCGPLCFWHERRQNITTGSTSLGNDHAGKVARAARANQCAEPARAHARPASPAADCCHSRPSLLQYCCARLCCTKHVSTASQPPHASCSRTPDGLPRPICTFNATGQALQSSRVRPCDGLPVLHFLSTPLPWYLPTAPYLEVLEYDADEHRRRLRAALEQQLPQHHLLPTRVAGALHKLVQLVVHLSYTTAPYDTSWCRAASASRA